MQREHAVGYAGGERGAVRCAAGDRDDREAPDGQRVEHTQHVIDRILVTERRIERRHPEPVALDADEPQPQPLANVTRELGRIEGVHIGPEAAEEHHRAPIRGAFVDVADDPAVGYGLGERGHSLEDNHRSQVRVLLRAAVSDGVLSDERRAERARVEAATIR